MAESVAEEVSEIVDTEMAEGESDEVADMEVEDPPKVVASPKKKSANPDKKDKSATNKKKSKVATKKNVEVKKKTKGGVKTPSKKKEVPKKKEVSKGGVILPPTEADIPATLTGDEEVVAEKKSPSELAEEDRLAHAESHGIPPAVPKVENEASSPDDKKCFNCGDFGHLANKCPSPRNGQAQRKVKLRRPRGEG